MLKSDVFLGFGQLAEEMWLEIAEGRHESNIHIVNSTRIKLSD